MRVNMVHPIKYVKQIANKVDDIYKFADGIAISDADIQNLGLDLKIKVLD